MEPFSIEAMMHDSCVILMVVIMTYLLWVLLVIVIKLVNVQHLGWPI